MSVTANMNLNLPTVGVTEGPAYASRVNTALSVIDQHDHSTGAGVQITPSGINISADLSIGTNNLTNVRSTRFTAQGAALPGLTPDLACLYVVGDNLYYNDGVGNQIALTIAGSVAGAAGNITGLVAPASVTYTSGGAPNYKFMSTASLTTSIDVGSVLMRNPGVNPSTFALTLQAPTLTNNYSVTLPALPLAPTFLQIDASGIITAQPAAAGGILGANIGTATVTGSNLALLTVTGANIANSTIASSKLSFAVAKSAIVTSFGSSTTFVVPANVYAAVITAVGGGAGGGGGGGSASGANEAGGGGGGGASGTVTTRTVTLIPGETLTITIAAGGTAGAGGAPGNSGNPGAGGGETSISAGTSGWKLYAPGGANGGGAGLRVNTASGGGAGGVSAQVRTVFNTAGGVGGNAQSNNAGAGGSSRFADGAAARAQVAPYGGYAVDGGPGGGGGSSYGQGGQGGAPDLRFAPSAGSAGAVGILGGGGGGGGGSSNGSAGYNGGAGSVGYAEILYNPLA